jgi:hypothetical protein
MGKIRFARRFYQYRTKSRRKKVDHTKDGRAKSERVAPCSGRNLVRTKFDTDGANSLKQTPSHEGANQKIPRTL